MLTMPFLCLAAVLRLFTECSHADNAFLCLAVVLRLLTECSHADNALLGGGAEALD